MVMGKTLRMPGAGTMPLKHQPPLSGRHLSPSVKVQFIHHLLCKAPPIQTDPITHPIAP